MRLFVLNKESNLERKRTRATTAPSSIGIATIVKGLVLNPILCTPLMMVQMALLQLVSFDTQVTQLLKHNRNF